MNAKNAQKKNNQPKKKKQTQSQGQRAVLVPNKVPQPGVILSKCVRDYSRCLVNPWTGPIGCIPSFPVIMSRKVRVWAKGTFSTGTNSAGWIVADPLCGCTNDVVASTFFTLPSFAGTTVDMNPSVDVGFVFSNADYRTVQISVDNILVKVVASGLRIRYTGTNLNMGGTIVALTDPSHNSLQGRTYQDFQAELVSRQFPFGREWINVLYKPVIDSELQSTANLNVWTPAATDRSFYMGVFVNSAVPQQPFEFEHYSVYEYEGADVRGQTPSHADPSGFAATQVASLQSPTTSPHVGNNTKQHEESFEDEVRKALVETGSTVVSDISSFIKSEGMTIVKAGVKGLLTII